MGKKGSQFHSFHLRQPFLAQEVIVLVQSIKRLYSDNSGLWTLNFGLSVTEGGRLRTDDGSGTLKYSVIGIVFRSNDEFFR
jgi:hypothetical protein